MYVCVCLWGGGLNDVVCVMMQLHLSCRGVAPRCLLYGGDWWMSQSECVRGSFFFTCGSCCIFVGRGCRYLSSHTFSTEIKWF